MNRLAPKLLAWYRTHARRLPWREHPSPYRTWVSEVMLQQTQVKTVIPYFVKFLRKFPTLKCLARAKEGDVLAAWAGLGYYSRARNLLRAAKKTGGRIPEEASELQSLPGIGPYTAAAIASIAFDKPRAALDGNVERVLARFFALRRPSQSRLWSLAEACLDRSRPGDWNQALMELGAMVCLPPPESPLCAQCPLSKDCTARRLGLAERLPRAKTRKKTVELRWRVMLIEDDGKVLLYKRPDAEGFLPGHWSLPEPRHLPKTKPGRVLRKVRHSIMHYAIQLQVRAARAPKGPLPRGFAWFSGPRLRSALVSSLWRKALAICPRSV